MLMDEWPDGFIEIPSLSLPLVLVFFSCSDANDSTIRVELFAECKTITVQRVPKGNDEDGFRLITVPAPSVGDARPQPAGAAGLSSDQVPATPFSMSTPAWAPNTPSASLFDERSTHTDVGWITGSFRTPFSLVVLTFSLLSFRSSLLPSSASLF